MGIPQKKWVRKVSKFFTPLLKAVDITPRSPIPQTEMCLCHCLLFRAPVNLLQHCPEKRALWRMNLTEILEKHIPHLKKKSFEGKFLDSPENFLISPRFSKITLEHGTGLPGFQKDVLSL